MQSTYSAYVVTVESTDLPITVAEARQQLRNEDLDYDDTYIEALIGAAVNFVEEQYGLAILEKTIAQYESGFPEGIPIRLRIHPLGEVINCSYLDTIGADQSVSLGSITSGKLGRQGFIAPAPSETWPTDVAKNQPNAVTVTYTAGFSDVAADIPKNVKNALLLIIADFYVNRDNPVRTLPTAAERLLEPYYPY